MTPGFSRETRPPRPSGGFIVGGTYEHTTSGLPPLLWQRNFTGGTGRWPPSSSAHAPRETTARTAPTWTSSWLLKKKLTIQHRRLNQICPPVGETSEVYGVRPAKGRRWLCTFERVLQFDTKLVKVSHVPGDHRQPVDDSRCGDHGVLGDSV